MKTINELYQKARSYIVPLTVVTSMSVGAYLNPIPITRNWGDIAARDMAAKVEIVDEIKKELGEYSADGKLDPQELIYIIADTTPRRFTEHRTQEMGPVLGIFPRFDNPFTPTSRLEDELYLEYNKLFSDGTKRFEKGELASYHEIRAELSHHLYNMFIDKDLVPYEKWLKGEGLKTRRTASRDLFREARYESRDFFRRSGYESDESYISRQYAGSIKLSNVDLDEKLDRELKKLEDHFSSYENQKSFQRYLGNFESTEKAWNTILLGLASLIGLTIIDVFKHNHK